jgi:predicted neutral ceramidase superfamily lipid hydrolase
MSHLLLQLLLLPLHFLLFLSISSLSIQDSSSLQTPVSPLSILLSLLHHLNSAASFSLMRLPSLMSFLVTLILVKPIQVLPKTQSSYLALLSLILNIYQSTHNKCQLPLSTYLFKSSSYEHKLCSQVPLFS